MVTNFDYLTEKLPVFDLTNLKVRIYLQKYTIMGFKFIDILFMFTFPLVP